jgi:hypothetical protein
MMTLGGGLGISLGISLLLSLQNHAIDLSGFGSPEVTLETEPVVLYERSKFREGAAHLAER